MLRRPVGPGRLLNPRGEITTGLAILRLTRLGHPRARGPTRARGINVGNRRRAAHYVADPGRELGGRARMRVERAGVVGAGTMGAAIAELLAFNGIPCVLTDVDQAAVDRGLARVRALVNDVVAFHASRADRELARRGEMGLELSDRQVAVVRERLAPKVSSERGAEVAARVRGTTDW